MAPRNSIPGMVYDINVVVRVYFKGYIICSTFDIRVCVYLENKIKKGVSSVSVE